MLQEHVLFTGDRKNEPIPGPTLTYIICPIRTIPERNRALARANNCIIRTDLVPKPNGTVRFSAKTKWHFSSMPRPYKIQPTVN